MNISKLLAALLTPLLIISSASAKTIEVEVKGLKCGVCASNIKKGLEKEASVESIKISLTKGLVTIETKKDADLADANIKKIVEDSGQSVKTIRRL